ncbi:hypothetical protein GCM10011507_17110 [Edaphobacter acidisoli]|uniref:Uncharacterized protein n=1 Tax=Edaphobacter acidisoli TaxID=2040573 RepID=A0A916RRY1_9BACT|nr:hypothetical protein [Edaphobacter acidisoli]GGA66072.1 hypothetical protein GCM10011507_17110 [Edaphobacter acidisoli]
MNITPDTQKKAALIAVFVLLMAGVLYYNLRDDSAPAPSAAPVVTTTGTGGSAGATNGAAKNVGTTAAQLDPTLRMGPMLRTESLVYSGSGRNIFSAASAPVDIPKPIAPARPKGPVVPVYTPPVGPPPPPPIDLKFFGTETSAGGQKRAFLLKGEDVYLASAGDIVARRYKVDSIGANGIVVEDLTDNNKQTLPLLGR